MTSPKSSSVLYSVPYGLWSLLCTWFQVSLYAVGSSLLQENTQLTVAILDALSSLNLSSSLLTEVI